jgi:hypothetical protein
MKRWRGPRLLRGACSGSASSASAATLEGRTFLVGHASPDAVLLIGLHGELETRLDDGTALTYRLGARLAGLLLELRLSLVGPEEEHVVIAAARSLLLPLELVGVVDGGLYFVPPLCIRESDPSCEDVLASRPRR